MTERIIPTDADATDFDYLAMSLQAEMQMNVEQGYFSKGAFDFYVGQMRLLCQRTLDDGDVSPTNAVAEGHGKEWR